LTERSVAETMLVVLVSLLTSRLGFGVFVGVALLLASVACGPSAQRLHCLDYCERNNDACLVQATNAEAIQQCSSWTPSCVAKCPP
jgi:hypothetical protein